MDALPDALRPLGFRVVEHSEWQILHRQGLDLSKFGIVDTFVIATERETVGVDDLRVFSAAAMREGRKHKHFLPCGVFSMLVTYAVVNVDVADPEVVTFIRNYAPKHYSAVEFPVIAERSAQTLHFLTGTPLWGALYYKGFRTEVQKLVRF